jgi:carboxypeptidase C (cathepsin A)
MGAVAPRRANLTDEGEAPPPPYQLVDNESTWLDRTDVVFLDPVSTGYSRTVGKEDPRQFHGLKEDIASVGDFIRVYTSRNSRWLSPKFILGESCHRSDQKGPPRVENGPFWRFKIPHLGF